MLRHSCLSRRCQSRSCCCGFGVGFSKPFTLSIPPANPTRPDSPISETAPATPTNPIKTADSRVKTPTLIGFFDQKTIFSEEEDEKQPPFIGRGRSVPTENCRVRVHIRTGYHMYQRIQSRSDPPLPPQNLPCSVCPIASVLRWREIS